MESRPISKTKHWRLVRVVAKAAQQAMHVGLEELATQPPQ
jgi:hypothetical protein